MSQIGGEPQRYFFVHLQKTAGTALFLRLRNQFGERGVYPMPEYQKVPLTSISVDDLVERFEKHRHEIKVVTGHFPLCVTEVLGVPFSTFTVLREPIERALSFLRHTRKLDARFRDSTLEEVYDEGLQRELLLTNHMVRMLSLRADEMDEGALTQIEVDRDRLELAKRNLAERIDVFGIQEHFEAFCDDLATHFGWDLGASRTANRTEPLDHGPDLVARIAEENATDLELYRYAVDLWSERHEALSASE